MLFRSPHLRRRRELRQPVLARGQPNSRSSDIHTLPDNPDSRPANTSYGYPKSYGYYRPADSHPSAHDNAYTHGGSAHGCPYCANVNGDAIPGRPSAAEHRSGDAAG